MLHRVGVLHVEQHQIGVPRHPAENIRRGIAARLDGRMHPRGLQRGKHLCRKCGLQERLAARERHTAAVHGVYRLVAQQFASQLPRADRVPAHRAAVAAIHILRLGGNALGIVAPGTAKRAPFQENGGADTRPVVYGELLDAENNPFLHCAVRSFGQI